MQIYIVRHGETTWNKDKRLQGRTNIPLSPYGRKLAVKTGEALKNTTIDKIYSSPLDRAVETATLIRGERDIPLQKDERIIELNFGEYEGRTVTELNEDKNSDFKYFFGQPELYKPGERGESLEELCTRAKDFMRNEIEPNEKSWERVMIVAHGAMNKAIMTYVKGHGLDQFWSGGLQKNCNVIMINLKNGIYDIIEEEKIFY